MSFSLAFAKFEAIMDSKVISVLLRKCGRRNAGMYIRNSQWDLVDVSTHFLTKTDKHGEACVRTIVNK